MKKAVQKEQMDSRVVPNVIHINHNYLYKAVVALLETFFGNDKDSMVGMKKLQLLMNANRTGLDVKKLLPEERERLAELISKNIWVKFYNSLPNEISAPVQYLKLAFKTIIKALLGVEKYKRSVFQIANRKLNVNVENYGYTDDKKKELFADLFMKLKQAIKMSLPSALNRIGKNGL